ncbi:MAG: hypothetical protein KC731_40255, partial [Myxococcales bacterium]|nr:hypothetical protein [Myxococcales bacterium]
MRARLVLPIVCASLLGCGAETTFGTDEALLGPGRDLAPWHASVTRARTTVVREDVTRGDASPRDGVELPRELRLDLFEDVSVDAALRGSRRVGRGRLWLGQVPGDPASEVSLAVVDGVYAGTVRSAGRLYQLGVTPDGEAMIVERDESQLPPEAAPEPPGPPGPTPPPSPLPGVDGDPVVDLLVVSTSAAEAGAGGPAALDAWLALAVQETNAGYAQSGVGLSLRMVHRATVSYDETGFDWSQTLGRLQGRSDGFMDEVHALRDEHGADHVMLIVDTVGPYAGIGYQLEQGFEPFFAGWAFSVVARDYAVGAYTFGHELGHNMGANHDHANASGAGYFPDSYGLQVPDHGYRTIMAYSCPGCLRINQWSNPDVMALGAPTGVVDWANNARALNATGVISAAYRPTAQAPPQDIAEMVSPEDGSAIPPSTTFVWTDAGAGAYHLTIGAEPGDTSYVDAEVG